MRQRSEYVPASRPLGWSCLRVLCTLRDLGRHNRKPDGERRTPVLVRAGFHRSAHGFDEVSHDVETKTWPGECHRRRVTATLIRRKNLDVVDQGLVSHHFRLVDGSFRERAIPFRYVWPSELDLMARIAGMRLRERWGGWSREPFTGDSAKHVSVWEKPSS